MTIVIIADVAVVINVNNIMKQLLLLLLLPVEKCRWMTRGARLST